MRARSANGDRLSIEMVEVCPQRGDLRLRIEVRQGTFAGSAQVWVARSDWEQFVKALAALERERRGEATIEGMSPGELRVTFRTVDGLGHVGVEGTVGTHGASQTTALVFSAIEFGTRQAS